MGYKSEYASLRGTDFMRAFRNVLLSCSVNSVNDAIKLAIRSKSKSFWVSSMEASENICKIRKGNLLLRMLPHNRELYYTLYSMYLAYENTGRSVSDISEEIVDMEAPRFYMSFKSAVRLYYKLKRERRKSYNRK